jgi:hypothetical protein
MDYTFCGGVDSSHADDEDTGRSTGGFFFFLSKLQGAVAAKSGQSADVALSSTESETVWVCNAATQGAFMKQFIDEMDIFNSTTFELLEDSQPAINAQKQNVSQSKFRHIKTKYHYIRQLIYEGWTKLATQDFHPMLSQDLHTSSSAVNDLRNFEQSSPEYIQFTSCRIGGLC